MRPLFREQILPGGVACSVTAFIWWGGLTFPEDNDILSASISVAAIFAGFLTTAMSIIAGLTGRLVHRLYAAGYAGKIVWYMAEAALFSLLFCVHCFIGYFVKPAETPWFTPLWFLFAFWMLASFVRVTIILILMILLNAKKA